MIYYREYHIDNIFISNPCSQFAMLSSKERIFTCFYFVYLFKMNAFDHYLKSLIIVKISQKYFLKCKKKFNKIASFLQVI